MWDILGKMSGEIILKLVDVEGLPVSGARAGTNVRIRAVPVLDSILICSLRSKDVGISNQQREITLTRERLFSPPWPAGRKMGIYILHEERRIGATCEIPRDDKRQVIELTLEPVCHVHGRLDSEDLKKVGRPLTRANVYMFWNRDSHGVMIHTSEKQPFDFSFLVPPGKYGLHAYGSGEGTRTKDAYPKVKVRPGRSELDMGVVDLPATKVSTLLGKPAPEIGRIRAWKNGSPLKLADLRGRVVILHFGGEYPCPSHTLRRLVELHEDFEKDGLTIISLYNCESMEQWEQRFAEHVEKYGGEPEVPFRIAVDGGKRRPIVGADRTIPGDTYATYDITAYPTTVLIDREGRIVEELGLGDAKKKLEIMLGITTEPEPGLWRQRFNKVYCLEDGQVLKRIPPPFIPERKEYYRNEYSRWAGGIKRPPDLIMFHWDGELESRGEGFGLRKVPLKFVLNSSLGINSNKFEGPDELLAVEVPGDWIVRKGASEEQKLRALEGILTNEIGRNIRFVKRAVERKTIVASGSFKYRRLPVVQDEPRVLMFSGDSVDENGVGGGSAHSVGEFLGAIGNRVNVPVIDRTEPSGQVRIPFKHYRSAYLSEVQDTAEKEERLIQLMDNISRQTNLQFKVEMRPVEKWFVAEQND